MPAKALDLLNREKNILALPQANLKSINARLIPFIIRHVQDLCVKSELIYNMTLLMGYIWTRMSVTNTIVLTKVKLPTKSFRSLE